MKRFLSLLLVLALVFAMVCAFAVNASAEEESAEETSAEEEAKVIEPDENGNINIHDAGNYILKNGQYSVGNFTAYSPDCVLTVPKDAVVTVEESFTNFGTLYVYGTLIVNATNALISGTIHVYGTLIINAADAFINGTIHVYGALSVNSPNANNNGAIHVHGTLSVNSTDANNNGTIHVYCDGKFEGIIDGDEVVQDEHDFDAYGFCKNCGKPDGTILSGKVWYQLTENDTGLTLTIGGEGEMPGFPSFIDRPWHNVAGNITAVEINSGVTSIGDLAFYGCLSLKEVTIPGTVERIGVEAFFCAGMTELTISEGVASIEIRAFCNCKSLAAVTIPNTVTSIGEGAFSDCNCIAKLTICDGVTSIETNAFFGCNRLKEVTIPASVTSIGDGAFNECGALQKVTIPASVTSIGENAFGGCNSALVIHGTSGTAAEQYAKDYGVGFFVDGNCKHFARLVCETCQAHLTRSQLLQAWGENNLSGSTISGGNLAIIVGIAALVIGLGGGFLLGRKKRKPAVAGGNNEETSTT